ncbi:MAG: GGDEF domain-containing protein, partial [Pseudomonadota bacterium]
MQLIDPELQGGDPVRSTFDRGAMDAMFPLHMLLSYDGSILAIGRTLEKLTRGKELIKAAFFDSFTVAKPGGIDSIEMLLAKSNTKLRIRANWDHALELRGMAVPAGPNVMLPLALGTKLAAMVDQYGLKVQDFSPADNSVELIYMIETQSAIINDSKQVNDSLMKAKVEAERLAMTDSLTGLPNRRALIAELEARLKRPDAHSGRFALLHLDLDKFKMVNDTLGHAAGDQVLAHAAAVFSSAVRDQDLIARIGGDEFVIVLHQNPAPDLVHSIGTQIIDRIAAPIPYREQ